VLNPEPVAIAGIAVPRMARRIVDRTPTSLLLECVGEALDDAGLEPRAVDGACLSWAGAGGSPLGGSSNWARYLGRPLTWVLEQGLDTTGIRGVLNAAAAIRAGLCETVVVGCAVTSGGPAGVDRSRPGPDAGAAVAMQPAGLEFADPFGADLLGRMALTARAHMHEYGTTPVQLAEVAAAIRNHGHANPEALMFGRGPYTPADILASPMVADPFHRLDLALAGEGACALVLTSAVRAQPRNAPRALVLSGAMAFSDGPHWSPSRLREDGLLGRAQAQRAYDQADIDVSDIDVMSLYDATSFEVIRGVEMLGLCAPGEGGPFVEGGTLGRDGRLPTNTDGGLLAHGFAVTVQLLTRVIEAVRQLRGDCGARQVPNAKIAVCTNGVATAHHVEILVLGRG
jgi:acetyl-CoA acetyltransferase